MSTVTTTSGSSEGNIAALLLANRPASPPLSLQQRSATSEKPNNDDRGPATSVELSDKVKAILAKAKSDQSVADRLHAFATHRNKGGISQGAKSDSSQQANSDSKGDIDEAFRKLTAGNSPTDAAQDPAPLDPAISFENDVREGNFSVSVTTNVESGSSETIVNGEGWSYYDWKSGDGKSEEIGWTSIRAGVFSSTFIQTDAAAASVTASWDAGAVSAGAG
jgi:hypothetical protein